jgi:hypothetical protein
MQKGDDGLAMLRLGSMFGKHCDNTAKAGLG